MGIRILVVDDHCAVREGLRVFLSRDPELEVVGEASDGLEAVEKARKLHPAVVVMDLLLPYIDGIEATAIIWREWPEMKVLLLTSSMESDLFVRAISAGACSYVLKSARPDELRRVIKAAAAGQLHPS